MQSVMVLIESERIRPIPYFAGGSDPFSRIPFTGFNQLSAVAPKKCQPFDKNRKGMMVAEGAGILILETLESALKKKHPYMPRY